MKRQLLLYIILLSLLISNSFAQSVYVTKSGKKYHTENCRYTNSNSKTLDISDATSQCYTPCKVCKPTSSNITTPSNQFETTEEDNNSSFSQSKETQQKVQCSAMTKAGKRCKRTTKSSNGKCWQHGGN